MTGKSFFGISKQVENNCQKLPGGIEWLTRLPSLVDDLVRRWSLTRGAPFSGEDVSIAWVAPVGRPDGSSAVLKVGVPHMESEHEIDGLRIWNGNPTVLLLDADQDRKAMLLDRCEPGTSLRTLSEPQQDRVIASLLRLWRAPSTPHPFRSLSDLTTYWRYQTLMHGEHWPDRGLVLEGLRLFTELTRTSPASVLLATDLHAGNALAA